MTNLKSPSVEDVSKRVIDLHLNACISALPYRMWMFVRAKTCEHFRVCHWKCSLSSLYEIVRSNVDALSLRFENTQFNYRLLTEQKQLIFSKLQLTRSRLDLYLNRTIYLVNLFRFNYERWLKPEFRPDLNSSLGLNIDI